MKKNECDGDVLYSIAMAFREFETFLILSHVRPDGDAIGSMLALKHYLQKAGRKVTVYSRDVVPELYSFLPGADEIENEEPEGTFDVLIAVDSNDENRIGLNRPISEFSSLIVNIDHHPSNAEFGAINWVEPEASSTAEMIMQLIESADSVIYPEKDGNGENDNAISPRVATCLYAGIATDTGRFQFRNSTARAFRCAARLVELGVDVAAVSRRIYMNLPAPKVRLLGYALQNVVIDKSLAYVCINREQLDEYLARTEHVDGIINYISGIAGIETAALLHELKDGTIKVSLRSRGRHDVNAMASEFGGGGHAAAAGFSLDLPMKEAVQAVIDTVLRHVGNHGTRVMS